MNVNSRAVPGLTGPGANVKPSSHMDTTEREKSLTYSLRDGMAWSVMVGFGENYVAPFALFLAASSFQMGLLAAIPAFLGSIGQTFSARLTDRIQVRRKIIVPAAALQGLIWIPLFGIPLAAPPEFKVPLLIAFVTFFSIAGHFISPPWNSLMGDLVHSERRGIYFARRNRICHVFTIVSVGLAGFVLHLFESRGPSWHLYGFITLFTVACAARLISSVYLSRQSEPPYDAPPKDEQFGYLEFLRSVPRSNFGRFVLFLAAMSFSFHISAPFFVVYVLRDLKFTYLQFTSMTCLVALSQILTLLFWGRAADRFGNKWVLTVCGFVLSAAPFFLPISQHFVFIILFQFCAASAGAGFNLAAANYIFDAVPPPYRARCVAYFSLTGAAGTLLGGLLGGYLADRLPAQFGLGPFQFALASSLLTLYLISGVFRLGVLFLFRSAFQEIREVESPSRGHMLFRIAFLRPATGARFEPLFATAPQEQPEGAEREKR